MVCCCVVCDSAGTLLPLSESPWGQRSCTNCPGCSFLKGHRHVCVVVSQLSRFVPNLQFQLQPPPLSRSLLFITVAKLPSSPPPEPPSFLFLIADTHFLPLVEQQPAATSPVFHTGQ
ncbi:hypothetical protein VPH35_066382 [Triticum aestivum]